MAEPAHGSSRARTTGRRIGLFLLTVLFAVVVAFGLLEVSLRVAARYLPPNIANAVLDRFNDLAPDGIYFPDEAPFLRFMVPNHETELFCNGYTWGHKTDEWGFRNAPDTPKDILLVGDSMIYGRGVEYEQTAGALLRTRYGHPAYNMSREVDTLYHSYISLRLFVDRFKPKQVILFVFVNDPHETFYFRPGPALYQMPELHTFDYQAMWERMRSRGRNPWRSDWTMRIYTRRLYSALKGPGMPPIEIFPAGDQGAPAPVPYWVHAVMRPDVFAAVHSYYRVVIGNLTRFLLERSVELRLVYLDARDAVPGLDAVNDKLVDMVRGLCAEHRLVCDTTHSEFAGCKDCYLAGDGHYSVEGNRRLAKWLDGFLRRPASGPAAVSQQTGGVAGGDSTP